jgi:group II intron reverse transcriptase/maturase
MPNTNATLEILEKRGKEGKKVNRLYRKLFQPELFQTAYAQIYSNKGATTPGVGEETLDGMSEERIETIIEKLRWERYRWRPVRRVYIPKENGKERPLGIPSGDDKILQTAMKILLEAYYEPTFSERSHGFRPKRGCHSALLQISGKHRNVSWLIEGDIKGCFDNIDHDTLIGILEEKIEDGRFVNLVRQLLKAGYMENWEKKETFSGTPQGGIVSPLLTNIYMDKFDKWVEEKLLPEFNYSAQPRKGRRPNPEYNAYLYKRKKAKEKGDVETFNRLGKEMKSIPSIMVNDEGYRKLEYVRYADDFLLSFCGTKSEAKEIKERIGKYLKDSLKLELSEEKTLITHARSEKARFLGYDLSITLNEEKRQLNGLVHLEIPRKVITKICRRYTKHGKPIHRAELLNSSDYDIFTVYQLEYRGLVQYYQMAYNLHKLKKAYWVIRTSLLKTLAAKHKTTVTKTARKYKIIKRLEGREYKVLQVRVDRLEKKPLIAEFGGISLRRNPKPTHLTDNNERVVTQRRNQLIDRMLAEDCEMCGHSGKVEIHHVRKLKDLTKPGRKEKPAWVIRMAEIRRKTLVVCKDCHLAIHKGVTRQEWNVSREELLESRVP